MGPWGSHWVNTFLNKNKHICCIKDTLQGGLFIYFLGITHYNQDFQSEVACFVSKKLTLYTRGNPSASCFCGACAFPMCDAHFIPAHSAFPGKQTDRHTRTRIKMHVFFSYICFVRQFFPSTLPVFFVRTHSSSHFLTFFLFVSATKRRAHMHLFRLCFIPEDGCPSACHLATSLSRDRLCSVALESS